MNKNNETPAPAQKSDLRLALEAWVAQDAAIGAAKDALSRAEEKKASLALRVLEEGGGSEFSGSFNGALISVRPGTKKGRPVARIHFVDPATAKTIE